MAEKPKKPQKLKARLPRGLIDRESGDILATRAMLDKIQKVYELYGFEPVETPAIEFTDALGKFLPDQDRPNEGVFSFQDDDEQWLSLRYDLRRSRAMSRRIMIACRSRIEAIARVMSTATRSRGRAASASLCNSTPTRWGAPRQRRMPRFA